MKELAKAYEPKLYEDDVYKRWEDSGFFNPDNLEGEPYSLMMPPPNVTGVLHLGHALENSLMDTMIRYQRMNGKKALLLPGTDHAAVATQARVEANLVEEGIESPREHFGREGLLDKIREYSEESKSTILTQIKKMGTSADWSRLAYTFDEKRNHAVNTIFKEMYDDGLIYRGYRVVNWSVKGQSTCSDDELVYVERQSNLYTFKYAKDFPIPIATTRPETKVGDTAVAVNPQGKWKEYIGQEFTIEHFGQTGHSLTLKVIGDDAVEDEFGTGALGVTTAHSPIDFDMYMRHKAAGTDIGIIPVIGKDGKMTAEAGSEYAGLTVEEGREKVVAWLRAEGLMIHEEEIIQSVGTSDRFKDVVEAIPMTQWFVDVNKPIATQNNKTLKQLMKEAVVGGLNGDENKKVTITPGRFEKVYFNWIDNLRDWCISRQIWWGHRIPVWYKKGSNEVYCGVEAPKDIENWEQDEDTLDTWFSSGQWTFSTLGWPENTQDFQTYHPTNWMQMGYEILFFWMARMILFSAYTFDDIPFKDVYIHGMLRNKDGKKFSKSDKNGIDPLDMIETYGTDALRMSLLSGNTPGNDSRFYDEKVESMRNLVNKLWNMSRFMLMNIDMPKLDAPVNAHTLADSWIIAELGILSKDVSHLIETYDFSLAAEKLREFTWSKLADWYLEIAKVEGNKSDILNYILNTILKLWHPYMPFVTEAIWQEVYGEDAMLMVERWPHAEDVTSVDAFDVIKNIITGIRSVRGDYKIDPVKKLSVTISAGESTDVVQENDAIISALARLDTISVQEKSEQPAQAVGFVESGVDVFVHLEGIVDFEKERERLAAEIQNVSSYVTSMTKKLANAGFVDNAPAEVVTAEKEKLVEAEQNLKKLQQQLETLN